MQNGGELPSYCVEDTTTLDTAWHFHKETGGLMAPDARSELRMEPKAMPKATDISDMPYEGIKVKDIRGMSCEEPSTALKPSTSYSLGLREDADAPAKTKKRIKFSEDDDTWTQPSE
jgi:hypothetical protein